MEVNMDDFNNDNNANIPSPPIFPPRQENGTNNIDFSNTQMPQQAQPESNQNNNTENNFANQGMPNTQNIPTQNAIPQTQYTPPQYNGFQNNQAAPQNPAPYQYPQQPVGQYVQNQNGTQGYGQYTNYPQQGMPVNNNNVYAGNSVVPPYVKNKHTGLKIFLISVSAIFLICIVSLFAFVVSASNQSSNYSSYSFSDQTPTEATTVSNNHPESDYSEKTDSNFEGLKLESPVEDKNDAKYTSEYAFNTVSPSVVGIVCYSDEITDVSQCDTQGTGIIITADGYIVTNAHLLSNSKTAYALQVVLSDGTTYVAGVVGIDTRTDLAILKIDAKDLTVAVFSDSDNLTIGEDVIAIGNPGGLGYQNSLTKGIISAVNREVGSNTSVKYLQTDAAINPGNSGGPLCNMYGQIIGINTSKIVSEKYEGMGFAIPSTTVKAIADDLIKNGYIKGRVKLGIVGYAVPSSMQSQGIPAGIVIESIQDDSPIKDTDIKEYDIITEIDGKKVSSFSEVFAILNEHSAGDTIEIKYVSIGDSQSDIVTNTAEISLVEDKSTNN